MKNKIFIGIALGQDPKGPKPCIRFPDETLPIIANSVSSLAHINAQKLGENWRERITYQRPTIYMLTVGEKNIELIEFIGTKKRDFEKSMQESFDCH